MFCGFVIGQAVCVAANVNVAAARGEARLSVEHIASEVGAEPQPLYRVLRLLAGLGVLEESEDRIFNLTELGSFLRSDTPSSVRHAAVMFGELPYQSAGALLHTVQTGETAFDYLYGTGHEPWLEQHPEEATTFHQAIAQLTQVVDDGILATLNLEGLDVLVDVGGGHGALLAPLLQRWPDLRGVLCEQESALAGAEVHLRKAGVFARCELVSGDFFDALPSGGAYLLKSVLHSWPDDLAERILRTCRDSAAPGAHLYIVERTVPEYGEPLFPKINDLIMLAVTGGRERTAAEYSTILQSAGFKPVDHQATTQGFSLIKGIAS